MVWDAPTGAVMNSAHHVCSGRTHSEILCLAEFVRLVCLGTKNRDKILWPRWAKKPTLPSNGDAKQVYVAARYGEVFGTQDGGESWLEMPLPQGVQHVYALACG